MAPERASSSDTLSERDSVRSPVNGGTSDPHLLDYLRVLSKRRWTALTAFVIVAVLGMLYIWTAIPVYETGVQLMIEAERPRVVVFKDTIEQESDKLDYQQSQIMILQSRALARRTIDALRLWNHPEFTGSIKPRGVRAFVDSGLDTVMSIVKRFSKSSETERPKSVPIDERRARETSAQARAIDRFLSRLSVSSLPNSQIVGVKFRSMDPTLAAAAANALAEVYTKQNLEFKSQSSKEASDWLGQQLEEQRKRVEESQAALQRYRRRPIQARQTSGRVSPLRSSTSSIPN